MRKKIGGSNGCETRNEYGDCLRFTADHNIVPNGSVTVSDTYDMGNVGGYTAPIVGNLNYLPSSFGQMGGKYNSLKLKKNKKKINIILEKLKKKYKNNIKINLKKELK